MGGRSQVNITLLGLGVVGSGVARALVEKAESYSRRVGLPLALRRVLVRDIARERGVSLDPALLSADPQQVLDTDCDIVVEVMGGEHPAYDYIKQSLSRGRYVVTANKEGMAKYGPTLLLAAGEAGTDILYEASVGGRTGIIPPLEHCRFLPVFLAFSVPLNGTTNYI